MLLISVHTYISVKGENSANSKYSPGITHNAMRTRIDSHSEIMSCQLYTVNTVIGSLRSTQPSILPGQVNRVPALLAAVKAGCARYK